MKTGALAADDFWKQNPPHKAIAIVKSGFGDNFQMESPKVLDTGHHVRWVVVKDCDTSQFEPAINEQLSDDNWQMVIHFMLDKTRYKPAKIVSRHPALTPKYNLYLVAPIGFIEQRPAMAYHATETRIATECKAKGLKPSRGDNGYANTEGKLYLCERLEGHYESAEAWVRLLSERKGVSVADYSILEVNLLNCVEGDARVYYDLHSTSGIVVDKFQALPVAREFRLSGNAWTAIPA
jgi:hypothetical protein